MKIELRRFVHYPRMSEETVAFNADVWVDGKKRGTVQNEGCGGPNNIHPIELHLEIDAYAKTLPPAPRAYGGGPLSYDADFLMSTIVSNLLIEKDLTKALKKKTVFLIGGKMYEMRLPHRPGAHEQATVLNDLPFAEALKLYKAQGK